MELEYGIAQLAANAQNIETLATTVADHQAHWKPDPDSWSILEVIHHLYDEERLDFRVRLDIILHKPDQPWPPIDPAGWVMSRAYNEQNFAATLAGFLATRQESLAWLRGLTIVAWDSVYAAPFGSIRAGDMFASWVAHDLLHIRQLIELKWAYTTTQQLAPYKVTYAGDW